MSEKTHWRKVVSKDNPHLTVWDIDGKTPLKVTIERTDTEGVKSFVSETETDMLFLHFRGGKKALGMCATNCAILEMATGSAAIEDWIGKKATLRTAVCKGDECIRLDVPAGKKVPRRYPRFRYTDKPKRPEQPKPETKPAAKQVVEDPAELM